MLRLNEQILPPPYAALQADAPLEAHAPHISLGQTRHFMSQFCHEEKLNNTEILRLTRELESDLINLKQQFSQLPTPIILSTEMVDELMNLSCQTIMNMLQHKDFNATAYRERLAKELQEQFNSRLHFSEMSSLKRKNILWEMVDYVIRTAIAFAQLSALSIAICAVLAPPLLLIPSFCLAAAAIIFPLALINAAMEPGLYSSNKTVPLTPMTQKIEKLKNYPMTFFDKVNEHLKPKPPVEKAYQPAFQQQ